MKLKDVQITRFRCIEDSTRFSVGDVCCLVGKNESGKTSVLHALERLNPIDSNTKLEQLRDYPRHLLSDFDDDDAAEAINTTWELDEDDVAAVEEIGYTDLMVDGAPSPHQSDTTLRWLIDPLRS